MKGPVPPDQVTLMLSLVLTSTGLRLNVPRVTEEGPLATVRLGSGAGELAEFESASVTTAQ